MDKRVSQKIHFHFSFLPITLSQRGRLKLFMESIFSREKKKLQEINFIFCNNKTIRKINKQYLQHDYNTDILTFPLSENDSSVLADVFISQEQVSKNAIIFNTSFKLEIHRVLFHGILHLCGYDDKTPSGQQIMRSREDFYLRKYFH
jgi:probable rRNA maturation factor